MTLRARHRRTDPLQRRPIVVANWKMYLSAVESVSAARALRASLGRAEARAVDVVLCPAFPALPAVRAVLAGSPLFVGAQDVHHEALGPFTGDVPVSHLRGLTRYVIVGHSERRRFHGETDAQVAQKVHRALMAGISPIICVGETAQERDDGDTVSRITHQVQTVLQDVPVLSVARCVFAYEPIWAISAGPGKPSPQPEPTDASHLMGLIRKLAADRAGSQYAARLRVVYGGSVEPGTVAQFVGQPGVDGALVGGASTRPAQFAAIVRAVRRCRL